MREAQFGVAVGKKGVGKSFTTTQLIKSYIKGSANVMPRRALIMDINDEFEDVKAISPDDVALFSMHPKIEARRIRPYNKDGSKLTLKDYATILFKVLGDYRGGLLLIEDINRYLSHNFPNDLVGALCTNRHSSVDIIMHYQSIGKVNPTIWQNINWLRFHKNTDSVDKHAKKLDDKYEAFKICELMVNKQYRDGNIRFFVTYDCDMEKIHGSYSLAMIDAAIDEYIALNYNRKVKPLLNMRDNNGKTKFTPATAVKHVKEELYKNYVPAINKSKAKQ